jgi:hypothetical protein
MSSIFQKHHLGIFHSESSQQIVQMKEIGLEYQGSSFQGRSFMRSGIVNSSDETYSQKLYF